MSIQPRGCPSARKDRKKKRKRHFNLRNNKKILLCDLTTLSLPRSGVLSTMAVPISYNFFERYDKRGIYESVNMHVFIH